MRRLLIVLALLAGWTAPLSAADELARYFDGLRTRGLFTVAETYALSRLDDSRLDRSRRTDLVVELSRTLAEHATHTTPQQREELWQQAQRTLADELARLPPPARVELLAMQNALLMAQRAIVLCREVRYLPFDTVAQDAARAATAEALAKLAAVIVQCDELLRKGKPPGEGLAMHELRQGMQMLRIERGDVFRARAEISPSESPERASDIVDALQTYRAALPGLTDAQAQVRARLGIADCARLQRDAKRARELLTALENSDPPLSRPWQDAVAACRMQIWLDEGQPIAAAQFFLTQRQKRAVFRGDLWLAQMQTLLALQAEATARKDQKLAAGLSAEAQSVLARIDEQAGGSWSRWGRLLLDLEQSRQGYGEELDGLIRRAKAAYLASRFDVAIDEYQQAIAVARRQAAHDVAEELSYTRGSILVEQRRFSDAAAEFTSLVEHAPSSPRAPQAHLLAAYALGRFYEELRSQPRREAYAAALQAHLDQFGSDVTAADARYMLGVLEEQRWQTSKALPLFLAVPLAHPRGPAALAGAARCYDTLVVRLQGAKHPWQECHAEALAALADHVAKFPPVNEWTPAHGEVVLLQARLHLRGQPPNYAAAARILMQFDSAPTTAEWQPVRQATAALQLVTLAGTGKSVEARRLLERLPSDPPALLMAVIDGLDTLAAATETRTIDFSNLFLTAMERLMPARDRLSPVEQERFDRARLRALLIVDREAEAATVAESLAARFDAAPDQLRQLTEILAAHPHPKTAAVAKRLWKKLEGQSAVGSPGWHAARIAIVEQCLQLGETDEADKLLKLTRLLYANTAPAEIPAEWDRLQRAVERLQARRQQSPR